MAVDPDTFVLCVQADLPLRTGYPYQKWLPLLAAYINGMGYDPTNGEVVYSAGAKAYMPEDDVFTDAAVLTEYDFGFEAWYARGGERQTVMDNPVVQLVVFREDVSAAQEVTLGVRGSPMADEAGGTEKELTLTLAIAARQNQGGVFGVSGEAIHVSVVNTDDMALGLLACRIMEGPQRQNA